MLFMVSLMSLQRHLSGFSVKTHPFCCPGRSNLFRVRPNRSLLGNLLVYVWIKHALACVLALYCWLTRSSETGSSILEEYEYKSSMNIFTCNAFKILGRNAPDIKHGHKNKITSNVYSPEKNHLQYLITLREWCHSSFFNKSNCHISVARIKIHC